MAAEEQIERILMEASAVNRRVEVIETAHLYLEAYPFLDRVTAFERAYQEECGDARSEEEIVASQYTENFEDKEFMHELSR